VTTTVVSEFFKGSQAISAKSGVNLLSAMVELTHRNTRRYGGYLVHMGIVCMFIGFTGAAFNKDLTAEVGMGDSVKIGNYDLRVVSLQEGDTGDYAWHHAKIDISKNGSALGTLEPERRFYKVSRQGTSEVAIRRRLNEDLYLNFAGTSNDQKKAVIQAYVFPLVSWIWIGFWVVLAGTAICLTPSKTRLQYARTEIVGITKKYAEVEK
jgi:Cytochrome c biogenesis factor